MRYFYRALLVFVLALTFGLPFASSAQAAPEIKSFDAKVVNRNQAVYNFQFSSQEVELTWSAVGAAFCAVSSSQDGVNFTGQLPLSTSTKVTSYKDDTYTLTCYETNHPLSAKAISSKFVAFDKTPIAGPTITLDASTGAVSRVGDRVTLRWSTTPAAAACNGYGGSDWAGFKPGGSGSISTLVNAASVTFDLTCYLVGGGSSSKSVTVTAGTGSGDNSQNNNSTVDIRANQSNGPVYTTPDTQAVNLTWTITPPSGGWACRGTDSSGVAPTWSTGVGGDGSGFQFVRPTRDATYTISCTNNVTNQTISDSVSVIMGTAPTSTTPITVDLYANGSRGPITVGKGDAVRLTWARGPATLIPTIVCTGSGATSRFDTTQQQENTYNPSWNGLLNGNNVTVQGGGFLAMPDSTTTYTVTCHDGFGGRTVSSSVVVNVSGVSTNPYTPLPPINNNPSNPGNTGGGNPGPACEAVFSTNLAFGSRGTEVLRLQRFLVAQGLLDEESTSGYFGPLTRGAVQQFQASRNIAKAGDAGYGQMGPLTRAAMNAMCGNPSNSGGVGGGNNSGQNNGGEADKRVDLISTSLGNNSYRLSWTSAGVTSCTSNDFYIPSSGVSTSGSAIVTTAVPKTYAISCVKSTGVEEDTVTVGGGVSSNDSNGVGATGDKPDLTAGVPTTTTAKTNVSTSLIFPITNGTVAIPLTSRSDQVLFYYFIQIASGKDGAGTIVNPPASVVGPSFPANLTVSAYIRHTFTSPGTYSFRGCADQTAPGMGGVIAESNENNNCGPWGNITVTN